MVHAKNYETASTILLKLFRENYWILFSGHGVYAVIAGRGQYYFLVEAFWPVFTFYEVI